MRVKRSFIGNSSTLCKMERKSPLKFFFYLSVRVIPVVCGLLANAHAIKKRDEEREETKDQDHDADVPAG